MEAVGDHQCLCPLSFSLSRLVSLKTVIFVLYSFCFLLRKAVWWQGVHFGGFWSAYGLLVRRHLVRMQAELQTPSCESDHLDPNHLSQTITKHFFLVPKPKKCHILLCLSSVSVRSHHRGSSACWPTRPQLTQYGYAYVIWHRLFNVGSSSSPNPSQFICAWECIKQSFHTTCKLKTQQVQISQEFHKSKAPFWTHSGLSLASPHFGSKHTTSSTVTKTNK